jgi:flagellar biosynthesis/type III secretory pathway protein FliH
MILRDVLMADEPRILSEPRSLRASSASDPAAQIVSAAFGQPSQPSTAVDAIAEVRETPAAYVREPVLTFAAVAAWLAVQDGETRAACASLLSDELTQVHETARAAGFEAGRHDGERKACQQSEHLNGLLAKLVDNAEAEFAVEQSRLADSCVEVVAEVFVKLAGSTLLRRDAIAAVVSEVVKRVKDTRELTIRVNAEDVDTLQALQPTLQSALAGRRFTIVADARVELGGCIVESRAGSVDGRLEVQLRELFETLRAARGQTAVEAA